MSVELIELTVRFPATAATPRELRESFASAIVTAVLEAHLAGRISTPEAEELVRTIPSAGRA